MRVIFHEPFDFVTLRAKNGRPRAMMAYKPGPDALTVKREHGEAAVAAGKAKEVKEPVKRIEGGLLPKDKQYIVGETGSKTSGTVELTDAPK